MTDNSNPENIRPIDNASNSFLGVVSSRSKQLEFSIPEEDYIKINIEPSKLFPKLLGYIGDISNTIANKEIDPGNISEFKEWLVFIARYFDAYFSSRLESGLNNYFLIIAAAAYYISELPGSSFVISEKIDREIDLDCNDLDKLLLSLLRVREIDTNSQGFYHEEISNIQSLFFDYYRNGNFENIDAIEESIKLLRAKSSGSPREFLFADIIASIIRTKVARSSWIKLPEYTGISIEKWKPIISKGNFMKELWPSQVLLGENGIFQGRSAIIQMPTSAGKTKSTELIIRSSFLNERADFAVIIAPFRALVHEISDSMRIAFEGEEIIINEISDVPQQDFFFDLETKKNILVITPEKLLYILRHRPELGNKIGLVIYDEGHQFDTGERGVNYELLITSLKKMIPENAQSILISAVISNAEEINEWLNTDGVIVEGNSLLPTYRTVGFASWLDTAGQIRYVDRENPDNETYFVPRVIRQQTLQRRPREKDKFFPDRTDNIESKDVALYLGLRLVPQGSVAIFCGKKDTAASMTARVAEIFSRNVDAFKPVDFSDKLEVERLSYLIEKNLGNDYHLKSSVLGVFSHHGNTPNGIRLAVENAMQKNLIKFIICTSTLAQGVNLPIRYLLVHATRQGQENIKVRDFHNLMGRAGRASMYTEGSVIFTDPKIYDNRRESNISEIISAGKRRWDEVKDLLDPLNNEPSISTLLLAFGPLYPLSTVYNPINMNLVLFIQNIEKYPELFEEYVLVNIQPGFTEENIRKQLNNKLKVASVVESYLMTNLDGLSESSLEESARSLAVDTLAYKLANDNQKIELIRLFEYLSNKIFNRIPEKHKREIFSKTLYGVDRSLELESKISQLVNRFAESETSSEYLEIIWEIFEDSIGNKDLIGWNLPEERKSILKKWTDGESFSSIYDYLNESDVRKVRGKRNFKLSIDETINILVNTFGYEMVLMLGAIIEIISSLEFPEKETTVADLQLLQKQLKYGLKEMNQIVLYEKGFADREVAKDLSAHFEGVAMTSKNIRRYLRHKREFVEETLKNYPSYYQEKLKIILNDES